MTPPCKHEGCKVRASFGLDGERWTRCAAHRTPYMVTKRCNIPLCFDLPEFRFIGGFSSRCAAHNMNPDLPPLPPATTYKVRARTGPTRAVLNAIAAMSMSTNEVAKRLGEGEVVRI